MSVKSHNLNLFNGGSVAKLNEVINDLKCGKKQQQKFLEILACFTSGLSPDRLVRLWLKIMLRLLEQKENLIYYFIYRESNKRLSSTLYSTVGLVCD